MELEYGHSDFGVDYSKLPTTPKTPRSKNMKKCRTPKTPSNKGDRFIPTRSGMDLEISSFNLMKENNPNTNESNPLLGTPSKDEYKERLAESLFNGAKLDSKVLAFKGKAPQPKEQDNVHKVLYTCNKTAGSKPSVTRHIPQSAERVLDAPGFVNDYYLNLVDWNRNNIVAVALSNTVYLWNSATGAIEELMRSRNESEILTSVAWTKDGQYVTIGNTDGTVEIWDAEAKRPLRSMGGHSARVGALAWNGHILSTGSKDSSIHHHDVRQQNHLVASLENHTQEICGLKWSDDGLQLASGGNDNVVNIWDVNQTAPKFTFTDHTAAVKALAWCPFQKDLLATGGGSADRTIRFWNTNTGACLNSIDTLSQVSSIVWSPHSKELVSSHGYAQNQLIVWKYPSLAKVAELRGHNDRIMSLNLSPDGRSVMSASADETLRFWRVFDVETKTAAKPKTETVRASSLSTRSLR